MTKIDFSDHQVEFYEAPSLEKRSFHTPPPTKVS